MLQVISNFVNGNLASAAVIIGLLLESALRLIPSEKPKSILLAVSSAVHMIAGIFSGLASFLDKVIPQNIK